MSFPFAGQRPAGDSTAEAHCCPFRTSGRFDLDRGAAGHQQDEIAPWRRRFASNRRYRNTTSRGSESRARRNGTRPSRPVVARPTASGGALRVASQALRWSRLRSAARRRWSGRRLSRTVRPKRRDDGRVQPRLGVQASATADARWRTPYREAACRSAQEAAASRPSRPHAARWTPRSRLGRLHGRGTRRRRYESARHPRTRPAASPRRSVASPCQVCEPVARISISPRAIAGVPVGRVDRDAKRIRRVAVARRRFQEAPGRSAPVPTAALRLALVTCRILQPHVESETRPGGRGYGRQRMDVRARRAVHRTGSRRRSCRASNVRA